MEIEKIAFNRYSEVVKGSKQTYTRMYRFEQLFEEQEVNNVFWLKVSDFEKEFDLNKGQVYLVLKKLVEGGFVRKWYKDKRSPPFILSFNRQKERVGEYVYPDDFDDEISNAITIVFGFFESNRSLITPKIKTLIEKVKSSNLSDFDFDSYNELVEIIWELSKTYDAFRMIMSWSANKYRHLKKLD